jgi:type IV secretory pathway VirJ component
VAPEVPRMKGLKVLCVAGATEQQNICKSLPPGAAALVEVPGGHGFEGDAPKLAERFLREAGLDPGRVDAEAKAGRKGKP